MGAGARGEVASSLLAYSASPGALTQRAPFQSPVSSWWIGLLVHCIEDTDEEPVEAASEEAVGAGARGEVISSLLKHSASPGARPQGVPSPSPSSFLILTCVATIISTFFANVS